MDIRNFLYILEFVYFPNIKKFFLSSFALYYCTVHSVVHCMLRHREPGQSKIGLFNAKFTIVSMLRGRFEVNLILSRVFTWVLSMFDVT